MKNKEQEWIKKWEMLEYNLFRSWFNDYPNLRHPDTAITSSLARNIARLIYDKLIGGKND